jgi:nicotinate-nucleotide pyrophosphorylase (carboxylating)
MARRRKSIGTRKDGDRITPNQLLCRITADARALLSAERSALNFLQLLSAVASKARIYADAIAGTKAVVVDTRKTLPGLRLAQKFAVRNAAVAATIGWPCGMPS